MDLSKTRVDIEAQEEGEEKEHPFYDDVKVTVRSIHSKAYRNRRKVLLNREKARTRKLGDAVESDARIVAEALAECVAGWKNITEDGTPVEYSPELVRKWAKEYAETGQYRQFFLGIRELAEDIGEGDAEAREESLGN